jgi:hypothetical protein
MFVHRYAAVLSFVCVAFVVASISVADPLPGEILKFQQLPLNNGAVPGLPAGVLGAPYYGHDELSTATRTSLNIPWTGFYMADDFADKFDTPVVHVRWWGSYLEDDLGNPNNPGVKRFLISFESDVPADPENTEFPFSHPGEPLLNQIVTLGPLAPGSGTFTETLLPTPTMPEMGPRESLYEYNAELHLGKEFRQEPDTVYWIKIVALVDVVEDGFIQWGWHSRDWSIMNPLASTPPAVSPGEHNPAGSPIVDPAKNFTSPVWHFQDDAVTGPITVTPNPAAPTMPDIVQETWQPQNYLFPWDGPEDIRSFSKDLAFELYTRIPEPSAVALMIIAIVALVSLRRASGVR